jgi:hypothetical protein
MSWLSRKLAGKSRLSDDRHTIWSEICIKPSGFAKA